MIIDVSHLNDRRFKKVAAIPAFQTKIEVRIGTSITEKLMFENALRFFERWTH